MCLREVKDNFGGVSRKNETILPNFSLMVTIGGESPCTSRMTPSQEKRHRSIFELPSNFFDSCRLLPSPHSSVPDHYNATLQTLQLPSNDVDDIQNSVVSAPRLTCNTCKAQFDSLQDQRSHFKSDIHRFNVRFNLLLSIFPFYLFNYSISSMKVPLFSFY